LVAANNAAYYNNSKTTYTESQKRAPLLQ